MMLAKFPPASFMRSPISSIEGEALTVHVPGVTRSKAKLPSAPVRVSPREPKPMAFEP